MKAPFYRIFIDSSKRDISDTVESFVLEDCANEDSLLRLVIKQDNAAALTDDSEIVLGQILGVQFGYIQGDVSEVHRFRITDVMPKYRERITLEIVCLDIGTEVKKATSGRVWTNKTSHEIAKEIAQEHGLEIEYSPTSRVWENMPQGGKNDLEFLRYLASRETNGNFQVYIRNKTLYFTSRNTGGDSIKTFTYGNPDGSVISFLPSIKESDQKSESVAAETIHIDPRTGEITSVRADNMSQAKTGTTGTYQKEYSANGEYIGMRLVGNLTEPFEDVEEATNAVNHAKKETTLGAIEATLMVEGQPLWKPDKVITVNNVGQRFAGNWYTEKVRHVVSRDGFTSIGTLSKNGLGTGTTKATDANTSIGGEEIKEQSRLKVYGGNGNFLRYTTTEN